MQYAFNVVGILVLIVMLCYQIWNFAKYRDTNGKQIRRIFFLLSTVALLVHEIRLLHGITTGVFLLIHICFLFFLFEQVRVHEFFNWLFRRK